MRFFFPDSQDFIDPSFDMDTEERSVHRVRQRDDLYPHEVFSIAPYHGILVSMAIVLGYGVGTGKYSLAQRARFQRDGVREFFRLDDELKTFGDCGAFSYIRETEPPFNADDAIEFYETGGFDYGVSVDHVIPAYRPEYDVTLGLPGMGSEVEKWKDRQEMTLELASSFMESCRRRRCRFSPVGVAQGWSPRSYVRAVSALQNLGYKLIALGGMVPLKTKDILAVLAEVAAVKRPDIGLHLLGVTRLGAIGEFARYGVVSFDSTAPLMRAFKDKDKNYFLEGRTFPAIRIPQVDGNPVLKRRILSGEVDSSTARCQEKKVLELVNAYARDGKALDATLEAILSYEALFDPSADRSAAYRQVLVERPWERCTCEVCRSIGVNVILFRGAERNRRRGFHNLQEFFRSLNSAVNGNVAVRQKTTQRAQRTRRARNG